MRDIPQSDLEAKVSSLLDYIYERRINKLAELSLREVLLKKNPYMYRAISHGDAPELVRSLLDATISSSDETIFGNDFFEPLVKWVAERAGSDGTYLSVRESSAEGADVEVETADELRLYAVKSGTNVYNSSSWKRQLTNFSAARMRLAKTKKRFDAVAAFGYGRVAVGREARRVAGQALWHELSGDSLMYARIMRAMGVGSQHRLDMFQAEHDKAVNRFTAELLANFANSDYSLDWEKLLAFNSAVEPPARNAWVVPNAGSDSSQNPVLQAEPAS